MHQRRDGRVACVGPDVTAEASQNLPADTRFGPGDRIVSIDPNLVLLQAPWLIPAGPDRDTVRDIFHKYIDLTNIRLS